MPQTLNNEESLRRVRALISSCEEDNIFPTDYRLCRALGIDCAELPGIWDADFFSAARAELIAYREDRLVQKLENDARSATGWVFLLRQPKYGGYAEKPEDSGTLTVLLNGAELPFG